MKSATSTKLRAINIQNRLHAYEHVWVALDVKKKVVASDVYLPALIKKLSTKRKDISCLTFLQVLPHNASFVSTIA